MMGWKLRRRDLMFLVETLMPERADVEGSADRIRGDDELVATMLDDERLFRRLMSDEEILLRASPWLFFTVLLRRARREMAGEAFTAERRGRHKVRVFDADQVLDLLAQEPLRDYLATLLASFTRVESVTVPVQMREGLWRWYRTSDLDVEGLMRYCQALDEAVRFEAYKRIADVCLFMTGVFPEYIEAQHRYPLSGQLRPQARGRIVRGRDDYEEYGRAFYRLAAEHEAARVHRLDKVLATLSARFVLAEKPLAFLANRYLGFARNRLFEL